MPSYTSMLLEAHRKSDGKLDPEDEDDIKGSAGTLYVGELINFWRVRAPYHLATSCSRDGNHHRFSCDAD